ncbi:MAG: right-handed parallel beta-helix repeat-containing protein [Planctomycetota bacterium]|jgi:hypothetical protein
MRSLLSLCLMVVLGGLLCAQTPAIRWVGDQVWMYDTIQEAIDACNDRDVVKVCDGTYVENIDFLGKAITVRSADNDPADCIIDGGMNGPVVQFVDDERRSSVLKGFSVINGSGDLHEVGDGKKYNYGGGIYIWYASPTIEHCWIHDNELIDRDIDPWCTASKGGGVYAGTSGNGGSSQGSTLSPKILDCLIYDNYASDQGAGICIYIYSVDPSTTIEDCKIYSNDSEWDYKGGIVYIDGEIADFHGVWVYGNSCSDSHSSVAFYGDPDDTNTTSLSIKNCLFYENNASSQEVYVTDFYSLYINSNTFVDGGGYGLRLYDTENTYTSTCYSYNNIYWDNSGYDEVSVYGYYNFQIDYCCIKGGLNGISDGTLYPASVTYGDDNTTNNPDFVNASGDNYHIDSDSPCVDEGVDTQAPDDDFEGDSRPYNSDYDIGADEYTG